MTTQHLLKFSLPEGLRVFPPVLREALARQNTLPPSFFSYDAETGKPLRQKRLNATRTEPARPPTTMEMQNPNAIPGVRIVGGRSWVGVLADERNKTLLIQSIPAILKTVEGLTGKAVPVEFMDYETGIKPNTEETPPWPYFCREMVIKKRGCYALSEEDVASLIKTRIENAIIAQSEHHGLICPTTSDLGIYVTDVMRPRGLRLSPSDGGKVKPDTFLVDVQFMANVLLGGVWFAGNLTARGYGRIGVRHGLIAKNRLAGSV